MIFYTLLKDYFYLENESNKANKEQQPKTDKNSNDDKPALEEEPRIIIEKSILDLDLETYEIIEKTEVTTH